MATFDIDNDINGLVLQFLYLGELLRISLERYDKIDYVLH